MQPPAPCTHPSHGEERSILDRFTAGDTSGALAAFRICGGDLYALRHGYESLGRILSATPEDLWRHDEMILGALCTYLVKQGRAGRARAHLDDPTLGFEKTVLFDFYDLIVSIHLGDVLDDTRLTHWIQLEQRLPLDEPLRDGLYYNSMLIILVRLNRLGEAQTMGRRALDRYRDAGHAYLEHFIHLHLADLNIVQGQLRTARRHVDTAEHLLRRDGRRFGNESDLIAILRLALDYETGRLAHIPDQADTLRARLVTGDSWAELFLQVARIGTMATYFLVGRGAALQYLERCQADYGRRHGAVSPSFLLIEAEINRLDWRWEASQWARTVATRTPLQSALGAVLLDNLRGPVAPDPETGVGLGQGPRAAIISELRFAAAARAEGRTSVQRRHVERALWIAVEEGHMAPFLEHRDTVARVSARLASGRFAKGHRQLERMARRTCEAVRRSYPIPEQLRAWGLGAQQFRVLTALRSGATNKQIARSLGISEATVKYHLGTLFRLFGTQRRGQLVEKIDEILKSAEN